MAKKEFVLVSLDDEKVGNISKVVNNKTCKKILKYLANRDHATETEISNELKIPISTVHYNLSELSKAGLVSVKEYHYSKKGKEILHYQLSNKYIIIAPRNDPNILDKLKQFIPIFLISIFTAAVLHFSVYFANVKEKLFGTVLSGSGANIESQAMPMAENVKSLNTEEVVMDSVVTHSSELARSANDTIVENISNDIAPAFVMHVDKVSNPSFFSEYFAIWFLIGTFFVITIMFILSFFKKKKD
jgi:DNA-binding transcriptional ArsR family regulator